VEEAVQVLVLVEVQVVLELLPERAEQQALLQALG
jgi:hypothetical protein